METNSFYTAVINTLDLEKEYLKPELDLLENKILDSLAIMSLIGLINAHYDVLVTANELYESRTLKGIELLIANKLQSKQRGPL